MGAGSADLRFLGDDSALKPARFDGRSRYGNVAECAGPAVVGPKFLSG
jgi:hypothetical protein